MNRLIPCLAVLSLAAAAHAQVGPIVNPANGHRYYRLPSNTWANQVAAAANLGGTLVTIDDAAENAWVRANVAAAGGNTTSCFIGINDRATEGVFVWQSGDPVLYTNWNAGEPNNQSGIEDNGSMITSNGLWNDVPAASSLPAIVEVSGPIRVPAEYGFIQDAIVAAVEGSTILVGPGTYTEVIDFGTKNLRLIAERGPLATTIRTFATGEGIRIMGGQSADTVLEGFTIVPLFETLWPVTINGSATVRGCRISGATNYGIYALGDNTISDCLLVGNGFGGVLARALNDSVKVTVQNCTIAGHSIGGIVTETASQYSAKVNVTNSIVVGNTQPAVIFARSAVNFSHSHVQGGAAGPGNSNADPRFVNAPGGDGVYNLNDDYSLSDRSPCIDASSNTARVALFGTTPLDALGNTRFADFAAAANTGTGPGAIADRGAIESQPGACPADFNADGFLDFFDYDDFVAAFEEGC